MPTALNSLGAEWSLETVLKTINIPYSEWREVILAPLVLVAASNGLINAELDELVYACVRQQILAWELEKTADSRQSLRKIAGDSQLRLRIAGRLPLLVKSMSSTCREEFSRRLWDAAVSTARSEVCSGRHIDDLEKEELSRLASVLGLGAESEVRAVLGESAMVAVPCAIKMPKTAMPKTAEPTFNQLAEESPALWASRWEFLHERAWADLDAMVNQLEKSAVAGKGILDNVTSITENIFADTPIIDSGVLLLPSKDGHLFVAGDIHGDHASLEAIIRQTGFLDSSDTRLLFLGDYGDRGVCSLAVWLRLAELKRHFPDRIHLLRGNHEDVVPVSCGREDGATLSKKWVVPATTDNESYLALAFALEANPLNVSVIYDCLPTAAILPDFTLAVHGGPTPGWKKGDGWSGTVEQQQALTVTCLPDLRKPAVQKAMRWTDIEDRQTLDMAWAQRENSFRLFSAGEDLQRWRDLLGITRVVHGHTHPTEGFRPALNATSLALNSNRITGKRPCLARWNPGSSWEKIEITVESK